MKRAKLVACGWTVSLIAALALIYQTCELALAPTRYYATVGLAFNPGVPGGTEAHDAFLADPSFVYSPKILSPVIDALKLRAAWGHKFKGTESLFNAEDTFHLLAARIQVHPMPDHADILMIDAYSDEAKEAVAVANEIVYSSRDYYHKTNSPSAVAFNLADNAKINHRNLYLFIVKAFCALLFFGLGVFLIRWGRKYPQHLPDGKTLEPAPIS